VDKNKKQYDKTEPNPDNIDPLEAQFFGVARKFSTF
jgi:hypothetical protein